jgi:16S rRNA (guanine966-N2)-methyltransferase
MRIIAGRWRGRVLVAPPTLATRPTADRVRQALFDMLLHAPWGGRALVEQATVLDAFAGTGAYGLEALSRGARHATFIEQAPAALTSLRANIRALGVDADCRILASDVAAVPQARVGCGLVFLDPPYGQGLVAMALVRLRAMGWIAAGALIVAETGRDETEPHSEPLAMRAHGAARLTIWREP